LRIKKFAINKDISFLDIVTIIYIVFLLSGNITTNHNYIAIGLYAIWFLLIVSKHPKIISIIFHEQRVVFFCIYCTSILFSGLVGGTVLFTLKQVIEAILLFSPIIIYIYYDHLKDNTKIRTLLIFALITWIGISLYSLNLYSYEASFSRSNLSEMASLGITNFGGYSLAYGSAVLSVFLFDLWFSRILKLRWQIFGIPVLIIIFSLLIIRTQSSVTILSWMLGLLLCIFLRPQNNKSLNGLIKKMFSFLIIIVSLVLIITFTREIGQGLISLTSQGNDRVSERIASIGYQLAYGSKEAGDNYFIYRLSFPLKSLDTFINNPLTGVAYKHGNGYYNSFAYGVSQHGEWADSLANYGIVFGSAFLLIYLSTIRYYINRFNRKLSPGWWTVMLMIGMFNPIRGYFLHFAVFLIIPFIMRLIEQKHI